MRRRLELAALSLLTGSCLSAPQVHPRAIDEAQVCAQYIAQGDLIKAEVHCDLCLQFSPFYADCWNNKGLVYLRQSQWDKSKDCFIKALRYNQEQAQAYNNLGYVYLEHEKAFGKAHDNFQRALKVNPDYIEARYNLSKSLMKLKQREKARKELRTIVAIAPNLADPHHDLGVMAIEDENFDEAIDELARATQAAPEFDDAWFHLGLALFRTGQFKESKEALTSCVEVNPKHIQCRELLPEVNRKGALLEPSLKEAVEMREVENTPAALYQQATIFREKGIKNEEERSYKRCLKLDPKYAPCHFGLHELYKEERQDKAAQVACKNFLKFAEAEEFPRQVETCERYLNSGTR